MTAKIFTKLNPVKNQSPRIKRPRVSSVIAIKGRLSTREMKRVLIQRFGTQCWGCSFKAPRPEYLQLDHIDPKSQGGANTLDNRALLCSPCNAIKSNTKTLIGLRIDNIQKGYLKTEIHPIDIIKARKWCIRYLESKRG